MHYSFVPLFLLWFVRLCIALSSSGNRLLVVLDEQDTKDKYSKFWKDLEGRGYALSFSTPKKDPALFKYGEREYDHLLVLPSTLKALGPALTPAILLDFMKNDGNILVALSSETPTSSSIVSLFLELDIHLPPDRNAVVVDHFNYDTVSADEKHDVLLVPSPSLVRTDQRNYFAGDGLLAVPRAVGQALGNGSPLLAPVIRAPNTAYSYNPTEEADGVDELFASGSQLSLVTTMQARNSARLAVVGSVEMLQDIWFDAKVKLGAEKQRATENKAFVTKLSGWTFKELGVLKVGKLQHYLNESDQGLSRDKPSLSRIDYNPKMYRIKNDVTYSIELSEYFEDHFIPFVAPIGDAVQLEFTMLSPYHRLTLQPTSQTPNSTIYSTSFRLPDQHGIFNFRINYKRPFLTNIDEKRTVTVRHFAHDEWPRSWRISGAWVWIAGVWTTVAAWLAFVVLWLYSEPMDKKQSSKKSQ